MSNRELKEYLNKFPDDADVSIILGNPRKRKLSEVVNAFGIIDTPHPTFCIDVGKSFDMYADLVKACEEDERIAEQLEGQMDFNDIPGVMP